MSELPPSPGDELYSELKAFVFERDRDFRDHESDISTISHPPYKRHVATLYDDYDPTVNVDVFNMRSLSLEAAYTTIDRRRDAARDAKIIFKLGLIATTQLTDVPLHLRQYMPADQPFHYDSFTPGDFSQVLSHHYTVAYNDLAEGAHIDHSSEYVLYGNDDQIYQAKFPVDQHIYQRTPEAPEQHTPVIPSHSSEGASTQPHGHTTYDEEFKIITAALRVSADTITADLKKTKADTLHTPKLLSLYEASQRDDAHTMRALLKILRSNNSIPTFENLHHTINRPPNK